MFLVQNRKNFKQSKNFIRTNEKIVSREVRVIDDEEKMLGVLSLQDALSLAKERGLDLVEVVPNSAPPVCKIIDYGKHLYKIKKKKQEAKKTQKTLQIKEIKLRPKIDVHDYNFKIKHAKEFLTKGYKVKFSIQFRGREMAFLHLGRNQIDKILEDTKDVAKVESKPKLEGRFFFMTLAPLKNKPNQN